MNVTLGHKAPEEILSDVHNGLEFFIHENAVYIAKQSLIENGYPNIYNKQRFTKDEQAEILYYRRKIFLPAHLIEKIKLTMYYRPQSSVIDAMSDDGFKDIRNRWKQRYCLDFDPNIQINQLSDVQIVTIIAGCSVNNIDLKIETSKVLRFYNNYYKKYKSEIDGKLFNGISIEEGFRKLVESDRFWMPIVNKNSIKPAVAVVTIPKDEEVISEEKLVVEEKFEKTTRPIDWKMKAIVDICNYLSTHPEVIKCYNIDMCMKNGAGRITIDL